ncbi:anchored repeat-type ABC transporter, permease subunit [Corynebacterium pyruviciproducens ATCC BAA-1742]|uniref:Anchored repeat-type ABC transporter, permease subunit n=1 Tax=Corynebacterium pyruviciproducens ATCC BAA-1742 TaxID=1125779 RepID=S2YVJ3_9CORY|nr:anchored repeat-type ABC transporter permease subunit [Corynebacterium pyruviciproducens]EPD68378.1 anchored repeat-type ABC transporter, permease subunit [Corynebacterium pyruviciproducens ATCC BAA-1742]
MLTIPEFLHDLTNPALAFLPRAFIIAVLCSAVCAVVGTHVVVRGMAFIGDAVAHAVFPGIAVAFSLQVSVLLGGAVTGAAVALAVAYFSQRRTVKEDTLIGIFFAAAFAAGLIVMSRIEGYSATLTSFLFGSITGVPSRDVVITACGGAVIVTAVLLFTRPFTIVTLDRETARALGYNVLLLDCLLYLTVAAAVVLSIRTVGNILVLALLLVPPATARLVTQQLSAMMLTAVGIGVTGSAVGLYLSWAIDIPTGATIVLTLTAIFLVVWLFTGFRPKAETVKGTKPLKGRNRESGDPSPTTEKAAR